MNSIQNTAKSASVIVISALMISCAVSNPAQLNYETLTWPVTEEAYFASLPADIHPDSRGRIPLVNRDDLDDDRKLEYDARIAPDTTSLAGLQGPGGLGLNGSRTLGESQLDARTKELARLIVSREMNQRLEWTVHEPVALRAGLEPEIIDVIRYRKSLQGIPDRDASIIQLGREIFQETDVSSTTFARVYKHLGKRNLVDLCLYMGNYTRTAILLHTFDVHLPYDREPLLPIE